LGKKRKKVKKKRSRRIEKRKGREKILYLFVFVIIIISIVVAAWYLTPRQTPTGTLIIHVIDEHTNNTIGGATVIISGPHDATGHSNEQGECTFESIPVGTYTVYAGKEGYHVHSETATVEEEKTIHHTIKLHTHH